MYHKITFGNIWQGWSLDPHIYTRFPIVARKQRYLAYKVPITTFLEFDFSFTKISIMSGDIRSSRHLVHLVILVELLMDR